MENFFEMNNRKMRVFARCAAVAASLVPGLCFGAAPFIDDFINRRHWLIPAYGYCFAFTLLITAILVGVAYLRWGKFSPVLNKLSGCLRAHGWLAVIVIGLIWLPIVTFVQSALWDGFGFEAFLLIVGVWLSFMVCLSVAEIRNNVFAGPKILDLSIAICLALILANALFIGITELCSLPGIDRVYYGPGDGTRWILHTHPYDSLTHIWENILIYLPIIPIALIIDQLIRAIKYAASKLTQTFFHNKKQDGMPD